MNRITFFGSLVLVFVVVLLAGYFLFDYFIPDGSNVAERQASSAKLDGYGKLYPGDLLAPPDTDEMLLVLEQQGDKLRLATPAGAVQTRERDTLPDETRVYTARRQGKPGEFLSRIALTFGVERDAQQQEEEFTPPDLDKVPELDPNKGSVGGDQEPGDGEQQSTRDYPEEIPEEDVNEDSSDEGTQDNEGLRKFDKPFRLELTAGR